MVGVEYVADRFGRDLLDVLHERLGAAWEVRIDDKQAFPDVNDDVVAVSLLSLPNPEPHPVRDPLEGVGLGRQRRIGGAVPGHA